jgi:hypothetical protein
MKHEEATQQPEDRHFPNVRGMSGTGGAAVFANSCFPSVCASSAKVSRTIMLSCEKVEPS